MKIINAGLGRTGTTSLQAALDTLGFGPCYHMFDIFNDDERLAQWERIVCDGERPDWESVFEGYGAVVNGPSSVHYRELLAVFPDARVVLTVRDAEAWYRSTYNTLFQFALRGQAHPPDEGTRDARMLRLTNGMTWDRVFSGLFADKDHAIKAYDAHRREVIDSVPADNLLVYDVTQGWQPLCAFLGVAVPTQDFPFTNDAESMRRRLARAQR